MQKLKTKRVPTENQLKYWDSLKTKKLQNKEYKMTIELGGNTFVINTDDLQSAILGIKPVKIVNKVFVKVEKGNRKFEKLLFVCPARRVFNNPLATSFFCKNIKSVLC